MTALSFLGGGKSLTTAADGERGDNIRSRRIAGSTAGSHNFPPPSIHPMTIVAHIVSAIDGAEELVSFALGGSSMGQEALEAIAAALGKKTSLKTAHFADIFTARKTEEIPVALVRIEGEGEEERERRDLI